MERALVVSPFVRPEFVNEIATRSSALQIVSTAEALDGLDDETFEKIEEVRRTQGSPVLYQVVDLGDAADPDGTYLDGLHAKMLLTEAPGGATTTYVGSANATGPGWGAGGLSNIEGMVEMRPGIGIDAFVRGFISETKTKLHPWVLPYERSDRTEPDPASEAKRQMLASLREAAKLRLSIQYRPEERCLSLSCLDGKKLHRFLPEHANGVLFDCAPLLLSDRADSWRSLHELGSNKVEFEDIPLDKLTAFVSLRARCSEPVVECVRLVLAKLDVRDEDLDARDDEVRKDILAKADPAAVLNALVRGLAHFKGYAPTGQGKGSQQGASNVRYLLGETSLERVLQAVALDPSLVGHLRQLVGPFAGEPFQRLCDDLDEVVTRVAAEAKS